MESIKGIKKNTNTYPEYIMQDLRQRYGNEEYDTSDDEMLSNLSPDEVFSMVCKWNGLLGGWDSEIKKWIKGIYEIELDKE